MTIPTEIVGSLPRPNCTPPSTTHIPLIFILIFFVSFLDLQKAIADYDAHKITADEFRKAQDKAAEDSVKRFEAAGQGAVTDGEQRVSS